jgi:hypothetical protein
MAKRQSNRVIFGKIVKSKVVFWRKRVVFVIKDEIIRLL